MSPTNDQEELFETILAGHFEFASPYWDDASQMAKDMITLMLQTDPELRFSALERFSNASVVNGLSLNVQVS